MSTKPIFTSLILLSACGTVPAVDATPSTSSETAPQTASATDYSVDETCAVYPCDGGAEPPPSRVRAPIVPTRASIFWANSMLVKWSAPVDTVDCSGSFLGAAWIYSVRTASDGSTNATVSLDGQQAASSSQADTIDSVSGAVGAVSVPYVYAGLAGRVYAHSNRVCAPKMTLEWAPLPGVVLPPRFTMPSVAILDSCTKAPQISAPTCR